jgi:hypothetical protein
MRRTFSVSVALVAVLALCGFAQAANIDVTNPGLDTFVDATFSYGGSTYLAGSVMGQNMYVTATPSGSIDNASTGEATGGTGTTTGYTFSPAIGGAGVSNYVTGQVGTDPAGCIGLLMTFGASQPTASIAQTLPGSVSLQANSLYTLTFDTYKRKVLDLPSSFTADLTVGGSPVGGTLLFTAPTNTTQGSGIVTFRTGSSPASGDLGFQLVATDPTASISQIFVDNMAMTVASVPEPGTFTLFSAGLLGLLAYAWRKQS